MGTPTEAPKTGAAYVFERVGGVWSEVKELLPSDGAAGDSFGHSVDVNAATQTAVIGAGYHDEPTNNEGAVYVFRLQ